MRLISGTLRSTPLPWLPMLSNIEPPALRRKAATDKLVEKIVKHDSWPIQPDILRPPLLGALRSHDIAHCGWSCNQLTSKVDAGITEVGSGSQFSPSVWPYNPATRFGPPSTVVSAEPFSHGTGTLRCLQKEMAIYRHWSVSLWRDPDDVPHCRILSPDKTEWRLVSATLCGCRRCFVADQLWFMIRIREEDWHMGKHITKRHRQISWSIMCMREGKMTSLWTSAKLKLALFRATTLHIQAFSEPPIVYWGKHVVLHYYHRSYLKPNKVSKSEGINKVENAYHFWKCADAADWESSKLVCACRNYSLPKLAHFLSHSVQW